MALYIDLAATDAAVAAIRGAIEPALSQGARLRRRAGAGAGPPGRGAHGGG